MLTISVISQNELVLYYRLHVMPLIRARVSPSCFAVVLFVGPFDTLDFKLCKKIKINNNTKN